MVRRNSWFALMIAAFAAVAAVAEPACAVITAGEVISYTPGAAHYAYWGEPYDNGAVALGLPTARQGIEEVTSGGTTLVYGDDSVITPANAPYNPDHIVAVGEGGSLTLKLTQPVAASGAVIGVHAAVGLAWDFQTSRAVGATYTSDRVASVRVSADGQQWSSLGSVNFDGVTNYYADATDPFFSGDGSQVADFIKPFHHGPADFANMTFAQVLQLLDGSAGGTWIDLTGSGLSSVQYIEFSVPAGSGQSLYLDSVVAVPEPAGVVALVAAAALLLSRDRRRRS